MGESLDRVAEIGQSVLEGRAPLSDLVTFVDQLNVSAEPDGVKALLWTLSDLKVLLKSDRRGTSQGASTQDRGAILVLIEAWSERLLSINRAGYFLCAYADHLLTIAVRPDEALPLLNEAWEERRGELQEDPGVLHWFHVLRGVALLLLGEQESGELELKEAFALGGFCCEPLHLVAERLSPAFLRALLTQTPSQRVRLVDVRNDLIRRSWEAEEKRKKSENILDPEPESPL